MQRRSDLQRINDAGKHLLSLVTEVLDITKIERNDSDIKAETFDVAQIIQQIKATCDSLAKVKKNELVLDLQPDLGMMHNDAVKFRQILLNLLSNAAKFTSSGRIVVSSLRRGCEDGEEIEVSVADSGIGMTPDEISRLFKRFSQASADTEKRFGGSGLGLSICASFCTLMGGSIKVDSSVGKGFAFHRRHSCPAAFRRSFVRACRGSAGSRGLRGRHVEFSARGVPRAPPRRRRLVCALGPVVAG